MTEIDPKLSRLYRETSTEAPPAALDAAILAAASRRVRTPQRRERASWARWIAPAGVMATLVLGVSVALLVERERPETTGEATIRSTAPPPARFTESPKMKAADSAAPAAPAGKPAQKPEPPAAAPAHSAADGIAAEGRAEASAPGTMSAPDAAPGAGMAAQRAQAPAAPAEAGASGKMEQAAVRRTPEAWLEAIRRLQREGRETEAAEQLAEFRKAYPAYPIPQIPSR